MPSTRRQDFVDGVSSVTISELQEEQRYCMRVQYIILDQLVGLSTCAECQLIPKSGESMFVVVVLASTVFLNIQVSTVILKVLTFIFVKLSQLLLLCSEVLSGSEL